ncbi:MAG: hypothetical protein V1820_03850 [archaeon]
MEVPLRKENSSAIKELLAAIAEGSPKKMKDIANHVLKDVPFTRDPVSIKISVICYSLSKVFNKDYYRKDEMRWRDFVIDLRNDLRISLEEPQKLDEVLADIKKLDESVGRFVSQVTDKALSKKASTLYAYGLSLGTATNLTGASKWDVLKEVGQTKMSDEQKQSFSLLERFKLAKEILGGGGG